MAALPDTAFRVEVRTIGDELVADRLVELGEPVVRLELEVADALVGREPFEFTFSIGRAHELVGALMVALANARGQLRRR